LRNHRGYICGYFDDDYSSTDYLLMRLEERSPTGIILAECSIDDYNSFRYESSFYDVPPKIEKVSDELILGRQKFLNFFQSDIRKSMK
jgi:hypothetical protein